jgi:hypothetical protein
VEARVSPRGQRALLTKYWKGRIKGDIYGRCIESDDPRFKEK